MREQKLAVVSEFNAALGARDWSRLDALLADDLTYTMRALDLPGAGTMDKKTLLAFLPQMLELFEVGSPVSTIIRSIVEGDWLNVEMEGGGSFKNGTAYENRYSNLFEIVDGRIRTVREYMDTQRMASLLAQVQG